MGALLMRENRHGMHTLPCDSIVRAGVKPLGHTTTEHIHTPTVRPMIPAI